MYILANIIGTLAIITWAMSIQNKEKKNIIMYQIIANVFYSVQYFLLSAFTAGMTNLLSTFRCLIFYLDEKRNGKISKFSFLFFALIIIAIGIVTYDGPISLIPVIVGLLYMYSIWQNSLNLTRYLFIIAAVILIFYNIKVGAIVCSIGNILDIISGIISIIRFRRK